MQINRLMGGGGILSNMKVIAIVGISSCYSGIFKGTDFLHGIKDLIRKLNSKITPFGTTLLTSVVTAAVSCNQTLSIMLTNQLCGENNPDKKEFALSLENSAVVVGASTSLVNCVSGTAGVYRCTDNECVRGNLSVSASDMVFYFC